MDELTVRLLVTIGEAISRLYEEKEPDFAEALFNDAKQYFTKRWKPETPCFLQDESPRHIDDAK